MIGLAAPLLLVLLAVILTVVIAIQRSMKKGEDQGSGADIVSYLVLALSMGVAGFALAELANTAFPGQRFVFDPAENLATSLAALVVSAPFAVFFWRRQADRRVTHPRSAGWTLYLSLIELVFMTAFVITAVLFVNGLISDEPASAWTGTVVFGAIVIFHDVAARRTPPLSDAGELQRVVGSAIGLITATIGLVGVLAALFSELFGDLDPEFFDFGFSPWTAMLIVGAPVWAYRWLRPWSARPNVPRLTWTIVVSVGGLAIAIGAATSISIVVLQYFLRDETGAGQFDGVPIGLGLLLAGLSIWALHRRALGAERSNQLRVYEYAMAAIGLVAAVTGAIALTLAALDRSLIVGGESSEIVAFAITTIVGLVTWGLFGRRSSGGEHELEATAWPRRIYNLGLGIVFGLVAAGALITTLFIVLQRILDGRESSSLLTPITTFVYTGLAAWYMLASYARDRDVIESDEVVTPFEVTIICSHPGIIATRFPKQARLHVIHRGDDSAPIDEEMAGAIVAAVDNKPTLVWVDEDGFRTAPGRVNT